MVYALYTDAEMLNWSTKGHADAIPDLVDRLTDLKTMLIQLRARLPKSSAADAEVYENTKKLMIEAAHTKGPGMLFLQRIQLSILNTLFRLCS